MEKKKETKEITSYMIGASANTLADIIQFVNDKKIKKEDIVQILETRNGYTILYYGRF